MKDEFGAAVPDNPTKLANGDLAFLVGGNGWAEIDMMGNLVQLRANVDLRLPYVDHELSQEPSGNLLTLSPIFKVVSGYPDGGGPYTYNVVGAGITELGLDGGVLNLWSEFGMLNPYDEGAPNLFNNDYWSFLYPRADGGTKDWTHTNAASVDVNDGNVVVSSRTLSLIYKFAPGPDNAAKLLWTLGKGGDFRLTNADESWMWNQHAAYALPGSDHIMCFDDGDTRTIDGAPCGFGGTLSPCFSRALELELDTSQKTATIVWQFRGDPPFYAEDLGSSYLLENGDVLVDSGGGLPGSVRSARRGPLQRLRRRPEQRRRRGSTRTSSEVTHDTPPRVVAHFAIKVPLGTFQGDPNILRDERPIYRARRIPSIY